MLLLIDLTRFLQETIETWDPFVNLCLQLGGFTKGHSKNHNYTKAYPAGGMTGPGKNLPKILSQKGLGALGKKRIGHKASQSCRVMVTETMDVTDLYGAATMEMCLCSQF